MMRRLLPLLLAVPTGLAALDSGMGPLGWDAAGLGAGGAVVATTAGAPALDQNPAGLATGGWDLAYGFGQGGPLPSAEQDLGLVHSLDDQLTLGLRAGDLAYSQADYREDSLGLAMAFRADRWFSLGTQQKFISADPGGLRGWSMDLGSQATLPLGGSWSLRAGAAVADGASSLAWGNGLEEVQPSVTRLGVAVEASPGTWLAAQQDHLDRQGSGGVDQWRAGAQWSLWQGRVALRGGATGVSGAAPYASAGLGLALPLAGQRMSLDYAALIPTGNDPAQAFRQVASLRWTFGLPEPPATVSVGWSQTLKDRQGRLRLARLQIADAPKDSRAWELTVRDANGRVVKTFKGRGVVPPALAWDGSDGKGAHLYADGLSYELRTTGRDGVSARRRALLAPAAPLGSPEGLALAGLEPSAWGLRASAAAAQAAPKVHLKGGSDLAISAADFNVAAVAGEDAKGWELRIVDAGGRTVKRIQGHGRPPRDVRWEGTDDLGQPVAASLGASYEIRVIDSHGQERVAAAAPVLEQAAFDSLEDGQAGRGAPAPEPSSGCERDPATGRLICEFQFSRGSSQLDEPALGAVGEAAEAALKQGYNKVRIEGWATGEGNAPAQVRLSQARADHVLEALMDETQGHLQSAVVRGLGEGGARRVELQFEKIEP